MVTSRIASGSRSKSSYPSPAIHSHRPVGNQVGHWHAVHDVRELVAIVETATSQGGVAVEVVLERPSAVNCDGLHTVRQSFLTEPVGVVDQGTLDEVWAAVAMALGC